MRPPEAAPPQSTRRAASPWRDTPEAAAWEARLRDGDGDGHGGVPNGSAIGLDAVPRQRSRMASWPSSVGQWGDHVDAVPY